MLKYYPRFIAVKLLKIYQKTLSFDHGVLKFLYPNGFCRFYPTCSDYAIAAVEKYGVLRGGVKAFWRVLRCNPFNRGGFDPLK
jgi:hypothetical protein